VNDTNGSTVRVVHDYAPLIGARMCFRWIGDRQLCCLTPGHTGTCLPLARFPRTTITPDNPRWALRAEAIGD
jgi:hypothetical protein